MLYKKTRKFQVVFPGFFYCDFGRFSAWGVKKHQEVFVEKNTQNLKKSTHPPPTHHPPPWAFLFCVLLKAFSC
jgi:hypothetical protein